MVGGVLIRDLIQTATSSLAYSETLSRFAQIAILLISILIAVDQIGLNIVVLTQMLTVLIAALCLARPWPLAWAPAPR